jgi:release factor glutamine methyltransferase
MVGSLSLLYWGKNYLSDEFPNTAWIDSVVLLEYVSNTPRSHLLADIEIDESTEFKFHSAIMERYHYAPVTYITNKKEFYGLEFFVDKRVLIPRPESEDLVEMALQEIQGQGSGVKGQEFTVADLGCGSGCIGIALAKTQGSRLKDQGVEVDFYDISEGALEVTRINLEKHEMTARTTKSDMFSAFPAGKKYDLVMANLPYVPSSMMSEKSIRDEPKLALVSGKDGLDHYIRLFSKASEHTDSIITESLLDQHEGLTAIAASNNWQIVKATGLAQLWIPDHGQE